MITLRAGWPRNRRSIPCSGEDFSFTKTSRKALKSTQPTIQCVTSVPSMEGLWPRCEINHSLPVTTEIKICVDVYLHSSTFINGVMFNPLNPELNPICYLLALLGAHHFLHVSRIRVKSLTFRRLMSYIYGAPILDVSRSHTTTQHSR